MLSVAVESFFILLREGLEALLVIAALAAVLQRAGEGHRRGALLWGSVAALLASLVAAWIFYRYFGGAHDDLTEAVVMAAAAVLLLYVSGWLWLRRDPEGWKRRLQRQADRALQADGPWRGSLFWPCSAKAPRPSCSCMRWPPRRKPACRACCWA